MKALAALLLAGKLGKFLTTGGTMLVSLVVYAAAFGWPYAAGFIALLFAHEMGHFLAARQRGLKVGAPAFIPFVGAWIQLKEQPMNAETEAYVGLAGPMLGTAAAFLCYLAAESLASPLLLAIAYAGFLLNLFNLVPLTPLDGGRIVAVISPRIWIFGIPILAGLFFWNPSPLLLFVAIFAIPQALSAFRDHDPDADYYQTPLATRAVYGIQYLLLVIFLALIAFQIHQRMPAGG